MNTATHVSIFNIMNTATHVSIFDLQYIVLTFWSKLKLEQLISEKRKRKEKMFIQIKNI